MSGNKHTLYMLSQITQGDAFTNNDLSKLSATISRFEFGYIKENEINRINILLNKKIIDPDQNLVFKLSNKIYDKINRERDGLISLFANNKNNSNDSLSEMIRKNIVSINEKNILNDNLNHNKPKNYSM